MRAEMRGVCSCLSFFFFQAEDGIRDVAVTGVQTCALPILASMSRRAIARKLAFLPQQPSAPGEMTIAQLVRQGRFSHVGLFRSYVRRDEEIGRASCRERV